MHIRPVRHPHGSMFQSLVDHVLRRGAPEAARPTLTDPHVHVATILAEHLEAGTTAPDDAPPHVVHAGGERAWRCMKLVSEIFMARALGRHERAIELEQHFKDSTCDPGWLEAIADYLDYFGLSGHRRKVPYIPCTPDGDYVLKTLPDNATVLLIGDWGTGTGSAVRLLEEAATHAPDVFVHLGDIYYAGTPAETRANFLDICNRVFDRAHGHVPIYTLAGNHDVYAGGVGYFSLLRELNPSPPFPPEAAQPASFFSLRNASGTFQLLAMDTGLHDGDPFTVSTDVTWIEAAEAQWHLDAIDAVHAVGGKTILLSHHQLFTAFAPIGAAGSRAPELQAYNPRLLETFEAALRADKVMAWFWGHEHNLCIYEPYGPLARGRCIGHGAIPVLCDDDPYGASPEIASPPALVRRPETGQAVQLPLCADGAAFQQGYVILRLHDSAGTVDVEYYLAGSPDEPFYRETMT